MSNPRHAHEYTPNRNGLCKAIVGSSMCHLKENADVHMRWLEKQVPTGILPLDLIVGCYHDLEQHEIESLQRAWAEYVETTPVQFVWNNADPVATELMMRGFIAGYNKASQEWQRGDW